MKRIVSSLYKTGKNVSAVLQQILADNNSSPQLKSASMDAVLNGGKRIRPFLVLETAKLFGLTDPRILRVAGALECVHCYSLVHDDLPAMDDDDLRRGQPTIHKKYDESTAILAGDGLLTLAFEILADPKTSKDAGIRAELCLVLAKASGLNGMVGGQMLDLNAEKTITNLSQADIENLQDLKTGKLIQVAVKMGCIMGGGNGQKKSCLQAYAKNIGVAFQVADDLLDALGNELTLGKAVGKDEKNNKATFVSLLGVEQARQYAFNLIDEAKQCLDCFGEEADTLRMLADFIIDRDM